jgi:hypothetical protein
MDPTLPNRRALASQAPRDHEQKEDSPWGGGAGRVGARAGRIGARHLTRRLIGLDEVRLLLYSYLHPIMSLFSLLTSARLSSCKHV